MNKEELIKTVIQFSRVKDIDVDYIYASMEIKVGNLNTMDTISGVSDQWGHVISIDEMNKTIKFEYVLYMGCDCCSDIDTLYIPLVELSEDNLLELISVLEPLLD